MPSYPITDDVLAACQRFPALSASFDVSGQTRSRLEIVRLLGNTHYQHVDECLALLDRIFAALGPIGRRLLQQTDPFQFNQTLSELFLFAYLHDRLPGRVQPVEGAPSDRVPDMEIGWDGGLVRIEVYSPIDFMGYQLFAEYLVRALKYLEVDRGFDLDVALEVPSAAGDDDLAVAFAYPYLVPDERMVRGWLDRFEQEAAAWLTAAELGATLVTEAPGGRLWVRVEVRGLSTDPVLREIIFSPPTRSTDTRLFFECGTALETARSQWGRKLGDKLRKSQCGEPADDLLRILLVDFSQADTGWPDFICWPGIAQRLDEVIRLVASRDRPPYDLVLSAQLGIDCCFGVPVYLRRPPRLPPDVFIEHAGLTRPCRRSR